MSATDGDEPGGAVSACAATDRLIRAAHELRVSIRWMYQNSHLCAPSPQGALTCPVLLSRLPARGRPLSSSRSYNFSSQAPPGGPRKSHGIDQPRLPTAGITG